MDFDRLLSDKKEKKKEKKRKSVCVWGGEGGGGSSVESGSVKPDTAVHEARILISDWPGWTMPLVVLQCHNGIP